MSRGFERLNDLNVQLSSGMKVNTVSDDVVAANSILALTRENEQYDVYMRNLSTAESTVNVAANCLETVSEVIAGLKQLAVQAASETYSASDLQAMAVSMDGMIGTLVTAVNAKGEAGYVFSGEAADRKPYDVTRGSDGQITEVTYNGEMIDTSVRVGPGTTAKVNLVGEEFINSGGDFFGTVIALRDAINASDQAEIELLIGELDERHTEILHGLGRLGERMSEYDVLRNATTTFRGFNTELISERQDADIGELSVQFNSQMALLEMVMKVAGSSLMPSLVDYV
jgi:flagellar hook-associated protein 3 FlgL